MLSHLTLSNTRKRWIISKCQTEVEVEEGLGFRVSLCYQLPCCRCCKRRGQPSKRATKETHVQGSHPSLLQNPKPCATSISHSERMRVILYWRSSGAMSVLPLPAPRASTHHLGLPGAAAANRRGVELLVVELLQPVFHGERPVGGLAGLAIGGGHEDAGESADGADHE
jgi:hypothetical protein